MTLEERIIQAICWIDEYGEISYDEAEFARELAQASGTRDLAGCSKLQPVAGAREEPKQVSTTYIVCGQNCVDLLHPLRFVDGRRTSS